MYLFIVWEIPDISPVFLSQRNCPAWRSRYPGPFILEKGAAERGRRVRRGNERGTGEER